MINDFAVKIKTDFQFRRYLCVKFFLSVIRLEDYSSTLFRKVAPLFLLRFIFLFIQDLQIETRKIELTIFFSTLNIG